jgi:ATP-binding protein involved in chromosome partitioning
MTEVDPLRMVQPAATRVRDPLSGRSVWLAGMVQNAHVDGDRLAFDLVFQPEHVAGDRRAIQEALIANLRGVGFEGQVVPNIVERAAVHQPKPAGKARVELGGKASDPVRGMSGPGIAPHGGPIVEKSIPGVRHIVAVASGKGGVGKSTVSTNLAVALRLQGLRVGLLDADVYGPSLPVMMNLNTRPLMGPDKRVIPPESYGVRCLSMGLLVDADEAMIWRGPMVMGVVRQFLQQTDWGELDVLLVDLPPGTGDAQLTLVQAVKLTGAVIVTTPQEVALADCIRGIQMFRKLDVPLLGVVENMAYYQLPDGTKDHVFGEGGGRRTAAAHDTELLAEVPLRSSIRRGGDAGLPAALGSDPSAETFKALAARVATKLGLA